MAFILHVSIILCWKNSNLEILWFVSKDWFQDFVPKFCSHPQKCWFFPHRPQSMMARVVFCVFRTFLRRAKWTNHLKYCICLLKFVQPTNRCVQYASKSVGGLTAQTSKLVWLIGAQWMDWRINHDISKYIRITQIKVVEVISVDNFCSTYFEKHELLFSGTCQRYSNNRLCSNVVCCAKCKQQVGGNLAHNLWHFE